MHLLQRQLRPLGTSEHDGVEENESTDLGSLVGTFTRNDILTKNLVETTQIPSSEIGDSHSKIM